ncbi:hypothetical protein KI387_040360 [Taxus chinensis]|uniref:Cytochrome P450 n=1 Tax=Taxus chinensis TaxID=29808 RepID=A0AA38C8J7_TAXCH|nr:hypothetical protein KI387_040360 [Taxus chinensis]
MDISLLLRLFPVTWHSVIAGFVALFLAWQQFTYSMKKSSLPGPSMVIPFIGSAIEMVRNPTKFWDDQAKAARNLGLSGNLLFEHRDLRRRFAPNFTLKALGVYVRIQEKVIRQHIKKWIEITSDDKPIALRTFCRDMNLETSQNAFVGSYLTNEAKEQFNRDYNLFNTGLMALPIDFPGFAFYKAKHAVSRLARNLADCAHQSKKIMENGEEPNCLVDFFMAETVKEIKEMSPKPYILMTLK